MRPLIACLLSATLFAACAGPERLETPIATPRPGSTAGGLDVALPQDPGDILVYLSCEALLFGHEVQSTPLFLVRLATDADADAADRPGWRRDGDSHAYRWTYDEGLQVDFQATPAPGRVLLRYTVTNTGELPRERVLLHTCVPTTHAPGFFPGDTPVPPDALDRSADRTELYTRAYYWRDGRARKFAATTLGRGEIHLALNHSQGRPVEWGWWRNTPETFDLPLVALESKAADRVAALGFERAAWASCNGGDNRACFHLFPEFGDLAPGQSGTVRGAFYLLPGGADHARAAFLADFPGAE